MSIIAQIESGIPIPTKRRGVRSKWPWDTLEIGDSFFVPGGQTKLLCTRSWNASKRLNRKFTCRTENGGVRVWRVA